MGHNKAKYKRTEKQRTKTEKGGQKMSYIHVCMGALPDCKNMNSYGVICVECNLCGRFDPPKQEKQDKEKRHEKEKNTCLETRRACAEKSKEPALAKEIKKNLGHA